MNLIKWEIKQTLRSKIFWTIGILLFVLGNAFNVSEYFKSDMTGYDMFLAKCNDFSSLAMFFIGIFASLHVTGAFEDRKISSAVMAGYSRIRIAGAKFLSFVTAVAVYFLTAVIIPSVIGFATHGTEVYDGSFVRFVIGRSALFLLTAISYYSVSFVISMMCKKTGMATVINMGTMMAMYIGTQFIASYEWGINVIKFTPVGQSMMVMADMSNSNSALAAIVSIVFITAATALSYAKFRKEELK